MKIMFDFENSATFGLMQFATAYRTAIDKAMNEIGLHGGQIFVLISLWKTDGQSQINLVRNLNLSAPTVHKMIKSLMTGDFIECRKCPSDNRLMKVFLTPKGIECQNSVAAQWNKTEARTLSLLTPTENLILAQLFGKLRDNIIADNTTVRPDI